MPPPPPISSPQPPLPDVAAVRLLAVPDSAPPYDDDMTPATRVATTADPAAPPHLPQPTGPSLPDAAGAWPSQFAQVLAETLAGSRAQGQIAPWTSDQARRRIRQLGPMLAAGTVPRVRRVVTTCPAADVVEMTVIVGFGPRIRALAVRLERDGPGHLRPERDARAARWVCTAIEAA
jgi:hypothetical protein